jgi:hypothetical protein
VVVDRLFEKTGARRGARAARPAEPVPIPAPSAPAQEGNP